MAANLRGKTVPAYSVDPDDLTLIYDANHPLYDERVYLPLDEDMVKNIMVHGVIEPVTVRRNGDLLEVADGRQRVKNSREANKRLKKEGKSPVRIVITFRAGHDKDIYGVVVSANEFRRPDAVLIKAAKAQRMLNFGATWTEVAVNYGCTVETIENWVSLLGLHPRILKAISEGKVKYTVAMRLARLPREKQMRKFRKLCKAGATNANALRVIVGGKLERVCPPSRQQLRRVADAFVAAKGFLTSDQVSDAYAFVSWVLGRISTEELFDCLSSASAGTISEAVKKGMGMS